MRLFFCTCLPLLAVLSCTSFESSEIDCSGFQDDKFYVDLASTACSEYNSFFHLKTKSGDIPVVDANGIIPLGRDSSLYVVNFCDNKGYVVISSDLERPLTYVASASGFFDGSTTGVQPIDYCLSLLTSETHEIDSPSPDTKAPVRIQRQFDTTVFIDTFCEPLCSVEWHQEAPFNNQCPTFFDVHSPAGCVPIAIAQAMSCFEYPQTIRIEDFNGGDILNLDWAQMKDPIHSGLHFGSCQYCESNAYLLGWIGQLCNAQYNIDRTDVGIDDALRALSYLGYRCYMPVIYDIDYLFSSCSSGYPSLLFAINSGDVSGHCWLVDGTHHYKLYRSIQKRQLSGSFEGVWTDDGFESDERWYLHFNYGYGGANNVYFLAKWDYIGDGTLFASNHVTRNVSIFSGGDPQVPNESVHIITHIRPSL